MNDAELAALHKIARVDELSYFFPAYNEEENLEGMVAEALEALPAIAARFEILIVDDGSRDRTPQIADALAAAHPGIVRALHHNPNRGYGAALRTGLAESRYELIAFTDGDRQFKVTDVAKLTNVMLSGNEIEGPDVVVGYRMKRADPFVRLLYAKSYRLALMLFFGLRVRDVDCAAKLFRRTALEGVAVASGGAFFSAELMVSLKSQGAQIAQVGIPHYPRTAGSATGAKPSVIFRGMRDFWARRLGLARPRSILDRGDSATTSTVVA